MPSVIHIQSSAGALATGCDVGPGGGAVLFHHLPASARDIAPSATALECGAARVEGQLVSVDGVTQEVALFWGAYPDRLVLIYASADKWGDVRREAAPWGPPKSSRVLEAHTLHSTQPPRRVVGTPELHLASGVDALPEAQLPFAEWCLSTLPPVVAEEVRATIPVPVVQAAQMTSSRYDSSGVGWSTAVRQGLALVRVDDARAVVLAAARTRETGTSDTRWIYGPEIDQLPWTITELTYELASDVAEVSDGDQFLQLTALTAADAPTSHGGLLRRILRK